MRGPHNGSMESPVSCSPVPARTDTLLYSCPLLQDLCALCRRGPAAGQTGCLWLKDGAELKQVAELPPHPAQTVKAKVIYGFDLFRHKGSLAAAHFQYALGRQSADGLSQCSPAHAEALCQFHLIWQFLAGSQRLLHHNPAVQALRCLLRTALFLHGVPFLSIRS